MPFRSNAVRTGGRSNPPGDNVRAGLRGPKVPDVRRNDSGARRVF
jgi:hypothetical protein